jgi:hypothetical protein
MHNYCRLSTVLDHEAVVVGNIQMKSIVLR